MTILIDTHTLLWFAWNNPSLSNSAAAMIRDPANRILVSIASCWELTIKAGTGKIQLGSSAESFLSRTISANRFDLLPVEFRHATFVETLPPHHKDPFDRLLIAQALVEQIPVLSADTTFDAYGITRLW